MKTPQIIEEESVELNFTEDTLNLDEEEVQKTEAEHTAAVPETKEEPKSKSVSKKAALTILFIAVNVIAIMVTALIDFGGQGDVVPFTEVMGTFGENFIYGLIALALFLGALLSETLKRYVLLKASLKHSGLFGLAMKTAVVTKYYDSITPFGTGGQPMEIYYMRKKGVPGSIASGIAITCYALGLFASVFITAAMLIWRGFPITNTAIKVMAIIGLIINIVVPLGVLIFSIIPKVGDFIAKIIAKFLELIHLEKNTETLRKNALNVMKEYANCIIFFFGKYSLATLLVFFFGLCYNIAIFSVPYFVMRLCGVPAANVNYFDVVTMCLICFCSVTFIPTPGNSGAAEISFYTIFADAFRSAGLASGILFWGVMSWRIATYYLFILAGLVLMLVDKLVGKHRASQEMSLNKSFLAAHERIVGQASGEAQPKGGNTKP